MNQMVQIIYVLIKEEENVVNERPVAENGLLASKFESCLVEQSIWHLNFTM